MTIKEIRKDGAVLIPAPPEFKKLKELKQEIKILKSEINQISKQISYIIYFLSAVFPEFNNNIKKE